jgi:hypothetical protein
MMEKGGKTRLRTLLLLLLRLLAGSLATETPKYVTK